jgi:hypothetical protein
MEDEYPWEGIRLGGSLSEELYSLVYFHFSKNQNKYLETFKNTITLKSIWWYRLRMAHFAWIWNHDFYKIETKFLPKILVLSLCLSSLA